MRDANANGPRDAERALLCEHLAGEMGWVQVEATLSGAGMHPQTTTQHKCVMYTELSCTVHPSRDAAGLTAGPSGASLETWTVGWSAIFYTQFLRTSSTFDAFRIVGGRIESNSVGGAEAINSVVLLLADAKFRIALY